MGTVRILSKSYIRFRDRRDAGRMLANELANFGDKNALVLGVPRGGVVIAIEVALAIRADFDIVLAHKLGTPGHPELAMGSVSENGKVFLNQDVVGSMGINQGSIEAERRRQLEELKRRASIFRHVYSHIPISGRNVIVTDDGVATGATTMAAIWAARSENPAKLVAAIPVGPEDTIKRLAEQVDELICLSTPPYFSAVGQFYQNFEPVEDEDVLEILKKTVLQKNAR
jgi:putative phosphoribosyl transferase